LTKTERQLISGFREAAKYSDVWLRREKDDLKVKREMSGYG
jgi:hypothetical protein